MKKVLGVITLLLTAGCGSDLPTVVDQVGLTVSSNRFINAYSTDLCTQFTGDACYFTGGQIVKYSDGSVYLSGSWSADYSNGTDSDIDQQTNALLFPSVSSAVYLTLSRFVSNGTGAKRLFLLYTATDDSLKLVYDTDGSGGITSGDAILKTLTTTNW